jgi:Flp pilus assembly protein TadD
MNSFSLNKKRTKRPAVPAVFVDDGDDDQEESAVPSSAGDGCKRIALEDPDTRFKRLRAEGVRLAEDGRFWQAVATWRSALELRAEDADVLEMTSQALMQVHEWVPAVENSAAAVAARPLFWEAHQTLGRANLGLGEVARARRAFAVACHLRPDDQELRTEDLLWSHQLFTAAKDKK